MNINRFDAISAELERLAAEIMAINAQPFDTRIDIDPAALVPGTENRPAELMAASLARINRDRQPRQ